MYCHCYSYDYLHVYPYSVVFKEVTKFVAPSQQQNRHTQNTHTLTRVNFAFTIFFTRYDMNGTLCLIRVHDPKV